MEFVTLCELCTGHTHLHSQKQKLFFSRAKAFFFSLRHKVCVFSWLVYSHGQLSGSSTIYHLPDIHIVTTTSVTSSSGYSCKGENFFPYLKLRTFFFSQKLYIKDTQCNLKGDQKRPSTVLRHKVGSFSVTSRHSTW